MNSTINKIIDIEAALVQKSAGLLTKIHDLSYTEEDPINKKLSDYHHYEIIYTQNQFVLIKETLIHVL